MEYLEQQPNALAEASPSAEMTNSLQNICQETFKSLQGDRFFIDFVTSISNRIVAH